MIANCKGCQEEYDCLIEYTSNKKYRLNFAGSGLFEKGHLILILVDDNGEVIVG